MHAIPFPLALAEGSALVKVGAILVHHNRTLSEIIEFTRDEMIVKAVDAVRPESEGQTTFKESPWVLGQGEFSYGIPIETMTLPISGRPLSRGDHGFDVDFILVHEKP